MAAIHRLTKARAPRAWPYAEMATNQILAQNSLGSGAVTLKHP
jgi:hypothetical protein